MIVKSICNRVDFNIIKKKLCRKNVETTKRNSRTIKENYGQENRNLD